jgi:hypothetical protein
MRKALGLVLALGLATHAFADETVQPGTGPTPATLPGDAPPDTGSGAPQPGGPAVDPAYGEHPDAHESATRAGANEGMPLHEGRDIVVKYRPDRPKNARVMLGVLGGAALAFGAVGLYYHLDSRDVADELSTHKFTSQTWTADRQATYDRGHDAKLIATISYSIGGAFLIATVVAFIMTEPPQQVMTIHPHTDSAPQSTIIAPIPGGAFVAKGWSF